MSFKGNGLAGKLALATLLITALNVPMAQTSPACQAQNARYANHIDDKNTINFILADEPGDHSDLEMVLENQEAQKSWQFRMVASNGYSLNYLWSREDNLRNIKIPAFFFVYESGANLIVSSIPQSGKKAPDKIFLPNLGVTFWYGEAREDERLSISTEMWNLVSCEK